MLWVMPLKQILSELREERREYKREVHDLNIHKFAVSTYVSKKHVPGQYLDVSHVHGQYLAV